MDDPPPSPATRRAMRVGVILLIVSVLALLAPLLVSFGKLAKYIVAPAFIGACIALSILLNAGIDRMRGK